jgi:hypothetical protein
LSIKGSDLCEDSENPITFYTLLPDFETRGKLSCSPNPKKVLLALERNLALTEI